jgi:hypothetical protein
MLCFLHLSFEQAIVESCVRSAVSDVSNAEAIHVPQSFDQPKREDSASVVVAANRMVSCRTSDVLELSAFFPRVYYHHGYCF